MLQKWVELPYINYVEDVFSLFASPRRIQKEFSLFEISHVMDEINLYVNSSDIESIANIIKFSAIAVIVVQLIYLYALITNKKSIKGIALFSAGITSLVSIIFLIYIKNINSSVSDVSYDLVNKLIKSTSMPYLAIIFSIIGVVAVYRLKSSTHVKQTPLNA